MLEFNPFLRKKPEEYIQMDIFKPWREKFPELLVPPPRPIQLEVDEKNVFDYNQSKFNHLSIDDIKSQIKAKLEMIQKMSS